MARIQLYYLGPEGTFTHQAAMTAADQFAPLGDFDLVPSPNVPAIMDAVQSHHGWGVIAWENNVEGYVVPNLDALIDGTDVAGFARISVDVSFSAFTVRGHGIYDCTGDTVSAHPHGLAQCTRFIAEHLLTPTPASSNAAACRDLKPGQVALGPSICGALYDLDTLADHVQDFDGARTDFLVIAPRDQVQELNARARHGGATDFETIITFIPLATGPGVVANVLDVLRIAGLNMTSFISRPIKGHDGTYMFIDTLDAAPWEPRFQKVLEMLAMQGIWLKTLAVYPRRERANPPVDAWMLPEGGIHIDIDERRVSEGWQYDQEVRKELLW
ncbi:MULTISPECIES: prephenate dehydratase domain-containing protein [unclassified Bifidobacterium]|uniref:prephenate dehydratase n=1 Tax=unclassified Bifidobacterium TaxID=2608897 RepID=UPI001125F6C7|nr:MULTISPECIES: prephenate dehydratase domain-containing protein [unclassified Bifidobacterium]TPF78177.1 chorismate mutase [Bifidobacterium sp. UTCIF-1]TPF81136.1 chorismate mutase [Bifidobacterium sp. UTCIF-24]TPF82141.1 chorismate mutase [Bifidobacterium sp. UTCIF-3]TPF85236.1 chorismate mutase [Bifidobacterium sp. UTCIF-36]TPF91072.1 chorismate mutase [Bifidobacterium sp. UTBIF-56]